LRFGRLPLRTGGNKMASRNETISARRKGTFDSSAHRLRSNLKFVSADKLEDDDVIVTLANAYENIRARQVTEWEIMRRRAVRQAA